MHPTARVALSILSFVGVAVLTFSTDAPYVDVDEAEAAPHNPCRAECIKAAPNDCKSNDPNYCWKSCPCNEAKSEGRACTAAAPCDQGSRCVSGRCAVACRTQNDCKKAGGTCKVGFCVRRSREEARSCESSCTACGEKLRSCIESFNRCAASCSP